MSALSDTITLSLVLILVFGSACLYLYTRIQQSETKINLLESILLDLKMTNELKSYPTMSYPAMSDDDIRVRVVEPSNIDKVKSIAPFKDTDEHDEHDEHNDHSEHSEHNAHDDHHNDTIAPFIDENEEKTPIKLSPNYEALTLSELKALAKQKGITGISGLRRAQLLESLKHATDTNVNVLDSLSGESSQFIGMSQSLEPEPAPNSELA